MIDDASGAETLSTQLALAEVLAGLRAMHGHVHWHWTRDSDPFEVAIGAILVQNTSWTNVERALERLRSAGALSIERVSQLAQPELEELLRPAGQYRQKARKVRVFLDLVEAQGGVSRLMAAPRDTLRARLLATWGIGPETADCIVLYAARKEAFVVDAYTERILSRLGFGPGERAGYGAWQAFFAGALPAEADLWAEYHALLVIHARDLCRKHAPRCGDCVFLGQCRFAAAAL